MTSPLEPDVPESVPDMETKEADVFGTETEPEGKAAVSDTPIGDAALAAITQPAKPADSASPPSADDTADDAPVHDYQVTHRVSQPGDSGASSLYTSAWHTPEEALNFVRSHKF